MTQNPDSAMPPNIPINLIIDDADWEQMLPDALAVAGQAWQQVAALHSELTKHRIDIVLADDDLLHQLNRDHRGRDKPTNVLSFSYGDDDAPPVPSEQLAEQMAEQPTGELYLAAGVVAAEAAAAGLSIAHHFAHLIVHGLLHLLGYDHELDEEAEEMEALETKILAQMGIANPYDACDTNYSTPGRIPS
jgi:probable rRNA maturation factor